MIKTANLENEIIDLTKELILLDNVNLPFSSLLMKKGTQKISSVITNWKYENLDNTRGLSLEGADVSTFQASDRSTGDKNVCQIITKAISVSDTAQAVSLDNISDLFAHELNNRMLEAKRDLEYYLINGVYKEDETDDTPRQMKGLINFITEDNTPQRHLPLLLKTLIICQRKCDKQVHLARILFCFVITICMMLLQGFMMKKFLI